MFEKWRFRNAHKFGRIEHKAGRWIAVPLLIGLLFNGFDSWNLLLGFFPITPYQLHWWINTALFAVSLIIWAIYLTSHTFEKKLYGRGLR